MDSIRRARRSFAVLLVLLAVLTAGAVFALRNVVLGTVLILVLVLILILVVLGVHSDASKYNCVNRQEHTMRPCQRFCGAAAGSVCPIFQHLSFGLKSSAARKPKKTAAATPAAAARKPPSSAPSSPSLSTASRTPFARL